MRLPWSWGSGGISTIALACSVAGVLLIGVSPFVLVATQSASYETAGPRSLNFDVASVKLVTSPQGVTITDGGGVMIGRGGNVDPSRLANTGGPGTHDPNRIRYRLITLKQLLGRAWNSYLEIEGPSWLNTRTVSIEATMPPGTTQEQFQEMLRNLIVSRFDLKYHAGKKTITGYALVAAKIGPKLKVSADQTERPSGPGPHAIKMGADGFPIMSPPEPGHWMVTSSTAVGRRTIAQQFTMQELAEFCGRDLKVPVTDATRLTAKYDFTLTYSDNNQPGKAVNPPQLATAEAAEPQPDIFSALPSELGLKLVPNKVNVPVMVIDHMAKMPKGN